MSAYSTNHNSTYAGAGSRRWKGKARAQTIEGSGGSDGIVIPLTMTGSGYADVAFTVPIRFGGSKELLLQVDTGSSDLWVVSSECSNKLCKQAQGQVYDPSSSTSTGRDFEIKYLLGSVKGPIVWDKVELGGYSIENQALAAAIEISDEPISPSFSGILGLALPSNSIIASLVSTTTSDAPDGAALAANLFGITPRESAPVAKFYSLSLSRPDSKFPSALLSIGRHPSEFVSSEADKSRIKYVTVLSDRTGTQFWRTSVHGISVWVDGERHDIDVGRSANGAVFPTAIVDSGVPLILTTSKIANALYGAINVQPASDGKYYPPCKTPLNMTFAFDNNVTIPLHPLDVSSYPPQQSSQTSTSCIGLIQAADQFLGTHSSIGEFILGVPFLRSAYTVMSFVQPDPDGTIPESTQRGPVKPALGMLPLTDPVKALDDFNTIRVLNRPLDDGSGRGGSNPTSSAASKGKGGISVGIGVVIGVSGFFALCALLFGLRWWLGRRRWQRQSQEIEVQEKSLFTALSRGGKKEAYELTGRSEADADGKDTTLTEDQLRQVRYQAYLARQNLPSPDEFGAFPQRRVSRQYLSYDTNATRVDSQRYDDPWDPTTALYMGEDSPRDKSKRTSLESVAIDHEERPNSGYSFSPAIRPAERDSSHSTMPLLRDSHQRDSMRDSMAGIGTIARGSVLNPDFR